ncbi:ORF3 [Simian torque teno virus 34]|uniref:ORF3 n=1 Tax=Simian torque teno virus 34 TaxID=1629657 RepID=A0A0C5IBL0_9VIRU|nr:ORF3 [Simian torque teno virus 34]AJP36580.1 ORF3 [Simian torque teno virus 34]
MAFDWAVTTSPQNRWATRANNRYTNSPLPEAVTTLEKYKSRTRQEWAPTTSSTPGTSDVASLAKSLLKESEKTQILRQTFGDLQNMLNQIHPQREEDSPSSVPQSSGISYKRPNTRSPPSRKHTRKRRRRRRPSTSSDSSERSDSSSSSSPISRRASKIWC